MSDSSWIKNLNSLLTRLRGTNNAPARVAVLGVGNELNGDDAAGVVISRRLVASLPRRADLLVLEAGLAPENFTGPLRRFHPDLILLVDAGEFGAPPGEVTLIGGQDAVGFSGSTHTLPLAVFAGYLRAELGCEIAILAVQPAQTGFDAPLSPPVAQSIPAVAASLIEILR